VKCGVRPTSRRVNMTVEVNFVSDFHNGRYTIDGNVAELKRQISARLNREINWNSYQLSVGDNIIQDDYSPENGQTIKAFTRGIKGGR